MTVALNSRKLKVYDFDPLISLIEEYVLGFQITMTYPILGHVAQTSQEKIYNLDDLLLLSELGIHPAAIDVGAQFWVIEVLHNDMAGQFSLI